MAAEFGDELRARGIEPRNTTTVLAAPAPLSDCDPWLTNFQKILTDGDPGGSGQFVEVAYQSLLPDIVKLQTRVADQQIMRTLKAYDDPTTEVDDRELTFAYAFDTRPVRGQDVVVAVRFNLRHLPPYFLRALDGLETGGLQAVPQDHSRATYAPKLRKEDGVIRWERHAVELANHIRGVTPWPGAVTIHAGNMLRIWRATDSRCTSSAPSTKRACRA